MPYVFPAHLFNPKEVDARPIQRTISGGEALSGEEDVILTDGGGRWRIDYSGITLHTAAQQRAWSAWQGHLAGGSVECLVPLLSLATAPRPFLGKGVARPPQLAWDDDLFPTTVAYSAPYIVAAVAANAALRATTLQITVSVGGTIKGGEKFSIGDRAHRIVRRTGADTFLIEPPLREAVLAGAEVVFDWPLVRCRAAPEDFEGSLNLGFYGEKQITFLESFGA